LPQPDEAHAAASSALAPTSTPVAATVLPQPTEPVPSRVAASAPAMAPAPAPRFTLPIDDLRALAASAGLEWVNSDAERILVVQRAMDSEPKPVHVPRVPKARVRVDEGPLVLVETRKDLSQLKLPFDKQQPPAP
jgi:ribonuclease E